MADKKKKETPYVPFKPTKEYATYQAYKDAINNTYKARTAGGGPAVKLGDWNKFINTPATANPDATSQTPSSGSQNDPRRGRGTNTGMYGTVLPTASSSYLTNPNKVGGSQVPVSIGPDRPSAAPPIATNKSGTSFGPTFRYEAGAPTTPRNAAGTGMAGTQRELLDWKGKLEEAKRVRMRQQLGERSQAQGQTRGALREANQMGDEAYRLQSQEMGAANHKMLMDLISALVSAMGPGTPVGGEGELPPGSFY
jgi:hypothetical protein